MTFTFTAFLLYVKQQRDIDIVKIKPASLLIVSLRNEFSWMLLL